LQKKKLIPENAHKFIEFIQHPVFVPFFCCSLSSLNPLSS
jgi:hypothetical protein